MSFNVYRDFNKDGKPIVWIADIVGKKSVISKEILQDLLTVYGPDSKIDRGGLTATRQSSTITIEDFQKVVQFELSTTVDGEFHIEFISLKSKGLA